MKRLNKIGTALTLIFLVGIIVWGIHDRIKLNKNFKLTTATITNCQFLIKSGGKTKATYEYYVGHVKYSRGSRRSELTVKLCNEHFLGKTFPVVYHPDDIPLSALLIFPDDFKRFDYAFPDSLKWVLDSVDRK